MTTYDDLHDVETRVTDAGSGGQKGTKATRIGALDPVALMILGRVAGMGADKYESFNYLRGFDYHLAYDAMMRHANLWWAGEDNDVESGLPHIAHAAWMAMALLSFAARGVGNDDRPPRLERFDAGAVIAAVNRGEISVTEARKRVGVADEGRYLCGHKYGEPPITDRAKGPLCGTLIHWSSTDGRIAL